MEKTLQRCLLLLILLGSIRATAVAQEAPIAFVGATLLPVTGPPIENGVLVIEDGEIKAIGPAGTAIPRRATTIDVSGHVIMPGLVDTHSHVGEVSGGDGSSALHPGVRTLDGINPLASSLNRARAGGITTLNIMSGSGHLMSGQTAYIKSRRANSIEALLFCEDVLTEICGGMKMANGTNSIRSGNFPGTRARSASMARELFMKAQQYGRKKAEALEAGETFDEIDLGNEALLEIMDGRRIVHFHTHRQDDILTALRIGNEFGFTPVLHHVSEGWKVADEIAAAGAPASIIMIDSPGGKLEAVDLVMKTGRVLEEAGALVAYHTDDGITDSRLFLRSAALGVRAGMSREGALASVTINGARMMGLEDRVGSLEVGKDADLVVLTGDPLSVYTHVHQTWIDGAIVFDRSNPDDLASATGGYGVYDRADVHIHGAETEHVMEGGE